jgi:hypothetical protein
VAAEVAEAVCRKKGIPVAGAGEEEAMEAEEGLKR